MPVLARLALPAAVLALAACGKEKPTQSVRSSVDHFAAAVSKHDYKDLCDNVLAENLISALKETGVPCETALRTGLGDAKDPKLSIKTIAVNGDKALVSVHSTASNQPPSDDTIGLVKEHGTWRVSSLAQPQPQPPQAP